MSGVFVEDPFDRIVNVHWKKKKDDQPPDDGYPPAYCGRYAYGPGLEMYPPFHGTFRTSSNVGPNGNQYGAVITPMQVDPGTITAEGGLHATHLVLNANQLSFTNAQLMRIASAVQPIPGFFTGVNWGVPFALGYIDRLPVVIKSYHINFDYGTTDVHGNDQFGIGISHPISIPGEGYKTLAEPPEPFITGAGVGGSLSFDYDFKWREWIRNEIPVNAGNQHDPNLGGPAVLFAMYRPYDINDPIHPFRDWFTDGWFHVPAGGPGSYYRWEVIGQCQQMPSIF